MLQPRVVVELSGGEDELCAQRREVRLVRLMHCSAAENPKLRWAQVCLNSQLLQDISHI